MSAPNTNLDKQKKRHKGPLAGMGAVVILAIVLLMGLLTYIAYQGNEPRDASDDPAATAPAVETTGSAPSETVPTETVPTNEGENAPPADGTSE